MARDDAGRAAGRALRGGLNDAVRPRPDHRGKFPRCECAALMLEVRPAAPFVPTPYCQEIAPNAETVLPRDANYSLISSEIVGRPSRFPCARAEPGSSRARITQAIQWGGSPRGSDQVLQGTAQ